MQTPMIAYVTTGAPGPVRRDTQGERVRGAVARCCAMHSGQITPTAAGVWHSPQIGRPQRWQRTWLTRSGWR
ncbi:hypothetical protein GCM10023068_03950 [Leifsonia shinshuensis]